ncbi:MAG: serine protease [Synechococcus sp.]
MTKLFQFHSYVLEEGSFFLLERLSKSHSIYTSNFKEVKTNIFNSAGLFLLGMAISLSFSQASKAQVSAEMCSDFPENSNTCAWFCSSFPYNSRCEPLFFGKYDRQIIRESSYPWSAIGTLKNRYGGHCTGTFVAPRLVLTAAHCLYEKNSRGYGNQFNAKELEYFAGPSEAERVVSSSITDIFIAPGFNPDLFEENSEVDGLDWAFLTLDKELGSEFGTINIFSIEKRTLETAIVESWSISQAGYGGEEADKLSAHFNCQIIDFFEDNTLFHECDALWGDSGSPLLVRNGNNYQVLAIDSKFSSYKDESDLRLKAVDARAFYETYLELTDSTEESLTESFASGE